VCATRSRASRTRCCTGAAAAATRIETAGTFRTQTEARDRRDLVAGWLARGTDPRIELAKLREPAARPGTREQWRDAWLASCVNLADSTVTTYRAGVNAVFDRLVPGRSSTSP
jgi:hypothetical protein